MLRREVREARTGRQPAEENDECRKIKRPGFSLEPSTLRWCSSSHHVSRLGTRAMNPSTILPNSRTTPGRRRLSPQPRQPKSRLSGRRGPVCDIARWSYRLTSDAVDASAYLKTLSSFCKFPTFLAIREVQTRERTKAPRTGGNQGRTTYANRGPVERPGRLFGQWKNRILLTTADRQQDIWP
jgi:hypothetical protein